MHRHSNFRDLPFKAYFKKYKLMKERFVSNLTTYVGVDSIRNYIYKSTKVIRFINYNPLSNAKSFVYNILL